MKIIKLTAENVKKLRAVEITPTGDLVEITGRNGAGKTSVLGASRFKGVSRHHSGRWRAEICANRARQYLGIFDTEEAAARAYDARAREVHRGFARPNFSEAGHVHI